MLRFVFNRSVLGFAALTVLALVLISYSGPDRPGLTPVEKIVKSLVTPVESGVTRVVNSVRDTVGSVFAIGSLKEENKTLKRRVTELEAQNNLLKEYEYQNLRLRDLLQFKDTIGRNYDMIAASVVAWNPSNDIRTVTINRGENDGVRKDMAVVTGQGLVGRVINTAGNSAEVLLITDKTSAVGALIQITRTPGVINGIADNSGFIKMVHIAQEAPVREKQVVVSSGLGGIYPKGLPIGRVMKVEVEANGLVKYAIVRPFVDFSRLEEVMVIRKVFGENVLPPSGGGE